MDTTAIVYALLLGILPAFFWLWFWLKEDNLHPEPRFIIAKAFISGAAVVILAVIFEKFILEITSEGNVRYVLWASVEEIIKFMALVIVIFPSKYMDEPIDAMIYCITVALGFAAVENTFFILSPFSAGDITRGIVMGDMRFIGATLVHIISSASIGFMIGISFYKNAFLKIISIIVGVILAIVLHTLFNLSIINVNGSEILKVFAWVWFAVVILLILFEEIKTIKPKAI